MSVQKQSFISLLSIRSIKSKLLSAFSLLVLLMLLFIGGFFWFDYQESRLQAINEELTAVNLNLSEVTHLEKEFFELEANSPEFYEQGKSPYLERHKFLMSKIRKSLKEIKARKEVSSRSLEANIDTVVNQIESYDFLFDRLIHLIKIRGIEGFGLTEELQVLANYLESVKKEIGLGRVMSLRKQEKDFIIAREAAYADKLKASLKKLNEDLPKLITNQERLQKTQRVLSLYEGTFNSLVSLEEEIGLKPNEGLKGSLADISLRIERIIKRINEEAQQRTKQLRRQTKTILLLLAIAFILLTLAVSYTVLQRLGKPIRLLSESINDAVARNFTEDTQIHRINSRDEIGLISQDVGQMLDKVKQRTNEVLQQKEATEQAYEDVKRLSHIGREITANITLDNIVEATYANLHQVIPTDVFAIALHNPEKKRLEFLGRRHDSSGLQRNQELLKNKNQLSVYAFEQAQSIMINDLETEYSQYIEEIPESAQFANYQSLIYLPIYAKEEIIGLITVQAKAPQTYTENHLSILHNLAIYIQIALENARIYRTLGENNEKIMDSIAYGQRIQEAMLPSKEAIQKVLPESFILLRPKDVVSGDFYWFEQKANKYLLAAIDCTGHGVPGAFMSMIGNDILNGIVIQNNITEADIILNKLHRGVRAALKQHSTENKDGMDLALCVIDFEQNTLEYAGAFNSMIMFRDGEMEIVPANKFPIGGWYRPDEDRRFDKHCIKIDRPTTFYIFSDGYADQIGGPRNRKFMVGRFRRLLQEIHREPMAKQQKILEKEMKHWLGNKRKPVDDVLVIGFKISPKTT